MKSVVKIDIDVQRARVAELFADPDNHPKWMHDIERVEAVRGVPGEKGSVYRLVPKRGDREFVATVVERRLPADLKLFLDSPDVSVSIADRLVERSDQVTRLISIEIFQFKGLL